VEVWKSSNLSKNGPVLQFFTRNSKTKCPIIAGWRSNEEFIKVVQLARQTGHEDDEDDSFSMNFE